MQEVNINVKFILAFNHSRAAGLHVSLLNTPRKEYLKMSCSVRLARPGLAAYHCA